MPQARLAESALDIISHPASVSPTSQSPPPKKKKIKADDDRLKLGYRIKGW
jgi:hypothetical protein